MGGESATNGRPSVIAFHAESCAYRGPPYSQRHSLPDRRPPRCDRGFARYLYRRMDRSGGAADRTSTVFVKLCLGGACLSTEPDPCRAGGEIIRPFVTTQKALIDCWLWFSASKDRWKYGGPFGIRMCCHCSVSLISGISCTQYVYVFDVPPGSRLIFSRLGQSLYGIRQCHAVPQKLPRSFSNPSPQRDRLWCVRYLCIHVSMLIVLQLPNIYIHAESSMEIYEG